MEVVLLILVVVAVLFAVVYSKSKSEPTYPAFEDTSEHAQHFYTQFEANRLLATQLTNQLKEHAATHDANDAFLFDNITYKDYIAELDHHLAEGNLSEKMFNELKHHNIPEPMANSMIESLEKQFGALQHISNSLHLFLRSSNNGVFSIKDS